MYVNMYLFIYTHLPMYLFVACYVPTYVSCFAVYLPILCIFSVTWLCTYVPWYKNLSLLIPSDVFYFSTFLFFFLRFFFLFFSWFLPLLIPDWNEHWSRGVDRKRSVLIAFGNFHLLFSIRLSKPQVTTIPDPSRQEPNSTLLNFQDRSGIGVSQGVFRDPEL